MPNRVVAPHSLEESVFAGECAASSSSVKAFLRCVLPWIDEERRRSGHRRAGAHVHGRAARRSRPAPTPGNAGRSSGAGTGRARKGRVCMRAPDYVEAIIAWRAWFVVADEGE